MTGAGSSFRTDTDISGRSELRERELYKWTPDETGEMIDLEYPFLWLFCVSFI